MDYPLSRASELGLYQGKFTSGVPGLRPASVDNAEFENDIVDSILAVQAAAGQAPIEGDVSQLLKGIVRLIQKQVVLDDTGTGANAYAATNVIPLIADTLSRGLEQRIVVGHTNTGASVYSPDGLAAKPILGLAMQPLQGGEMVAGGIAVLAYSPTANDNAGAWILVRCSGGAQQLAAASKSNHALTKGQADSLYAAIGDVSSQVGKPFFWPVGSSPSDGILMNGASLPSATYPALFSKLVKYQNGATISIATPGVINWPSHGFAANAPVKFTTTGALPTGITAGTTYYVVSTGLATDTFQISATVGGTAINLSGSQSGTHTAISAPYGCANDLSTFNVPNVPSDYTVVQASGNEGSQTVGQVISHSHAIDYSTVNTGGGSGGYSPVNSSTPGNATGGSANLAAGVRMRFYIHFK